MAQTKNHDNGAPRPLRWIVYVSSDKRVLWVDADAGPSATVYQVLQESREADLTSCPVDLVRENATFAAALATGLPQTGQHNYNLEQGCHTYSVQAIPEFGPDGLCRGVIQVLEMVDECSEPSQCRNSPLESLADRALKGLIMYDPVANRIISLNRRVAQIFGYAMHDLMGQPGGRLFTTDSAAILTKLFHRVPETGSGIVWGQVLTFVHHSGMETHFFCSVRAMPERMEADAPLALCVALDPMSYGCENMTGAIPNQRFLVEAIEDGLWELDVVRRRFYYSPKFADLFGADGAKSSQGKSFDHWINALHPDDSERVYRNWRQLLKYGKRYRMSYRIRDQNGGWRWVLASIHAVVNDNQGVPLRILGMHMDISEVMQAEKKLTDAEAQLRMIFENAGIGIVVAGLDGTIDKVNPAMAQMLGREIDEIVGRKLEDFAMEEDRENMTLALNRLVRGGCKRVDREYRFPLKDKVVWVELVATISRNELDGTRSVTAMVEDVTERRQQQNQLLYDATHDGLTGAWNRSVVMERLTEYLILAQRHSQHLTFCMSDLDHFKLVNDFHGHQAGDQVLSAFVDVLNQHVRETDMVGRLGGEEFCVIFPGTTIEGAAAAMERARQAIRAMRFTDDAGNVFTISATFGLTSINKHSTVKTVVAEADAALYRGKQSGRDCIVVHSND